MARESTDARVRYIKAPECAGYGSRHLRNLALANSHGEYIAYLDDDNWWEPYHLESLLSVLYPWCNFAWSGSVLWDGKKKVGSRINSRPVRNGIDANEIMHHRHLTDHVGGWSDHRNRMDNDWELVKRFMAAGYNGFHVNLLTVNYSTHPKTRRYRMKRKLYEMIGWNLAPGEVSCGS